MEEEDEEEEKEEEEEKVEGGLRETASGPHRHLDSAAMFFCRLIKQLGEEKDVGFLEKGRKYRGGRGGKPTKGEGNEEEMMEESREDGRESSCLEVE